MRCRPRNQYILIASISAFAVFVYSQTQFQAGYAVIAPTPGTPAPVATALFSFKNSSGVLVWEAGVGAVQPIRRGRLFVDQRGTRTAIALVNPASGPAVVTLILRNASGREIDRKVRALGIRQQLALFADELFAGLPSDFIGTLTFEASDIGSELAAITLRASINFYGETIYTTLPVVDMQAPSTQMIIFPHVGAGVGLSTQLLLMNRTSQTVSGRVQLRRSDGTPLVLQQNRVATSQFSYVLEPNGVYQTELTSLSTSAVGYAVVSADQPSSAPAGSAVFQIKSGSSVISEGGVAPVAPTTAARIFVDHNSTRTGVAIANAEAYFGSSLHIRESPIC